MALRIAIDGGGTHSRFGLYSADGALLGESEGGSLNLVSDGPVHCAANIVQQLRALRESSGVSLPVTAIHAALAGAGSRDASAALAQSLGTALMAEEVCITTDLQALFLANLGRGPGLAVIAGTGSSLLARRPDGTWMRKGGRGTVLGDAGSGYQIAVRALQAMAAHLDGVGPSTVLTEVFLHQRPEEEWPTFLARAGKHAIAALARDVSSAAATGDAVALHCIQTEAEALAHLACVLCASIDARDPLPVVVHGGVFRDCHGFHDAFRRTLEAVAEAAIRPAAMEGHAAAAALHSYREDCAWTACWSRAAAESGAEAVTEIARAAQPPLDLLPPEKMVSVMQEADEEALRAVGLAHAAITRAIEMAAAALEAGGRLLYLGAGTSGRLGVLDASECPPTFGVPADRVVGIIAGGEDALRHSVEGAEDDEVQGRHDIDACQPGKRDLVIGIAASGDTPYVRAGLAHAKDLGASTVLLCCNPLAAFDGDLCIALATGPEVLPGSTRLKAGTATKLVLNRISTGALARAGFVYDGRMVGVRPVNAKLRRRAVRIFEELTGLPSALAAQRLEEGGNDIRVAVLMKRKHWRREKAESVLRDARGNLRRALEHD